MRERERENNSIPYAKMSFTSEAPDANLDWRWTEVRRCIIIVGQVQICQTLWSTVHKTKPTQNPNFETESVSMRTQQHLMNSYHHKLLLVSNRYSIFGAMGFMGTTISAPSLVQIQVQTKGAWFLSVSFWYTYQKLESEKSEKRFQSKPVLENGRGENSDPVGGSSIFALIESDCHISICTSLYKRSMI